VFNLNNEEIENKKKEKKKYKLEELLKNCNEENRHDEMITDIQGKELI
jgi:hypothetical protein